MMKNMKKIIALLIATVMVLGMSTSVLAAASITINRDSSAETGTTSGTVFSYYEVLKADLSALTEEDYNADGSPKTGTKVVYYVDKEALANALPATYFKVTRVGTTSRWNVELIGNPSGADLATALNIDAVKNNAEASGDFTMTGTSVTKTGLEEGYYLITASNGTVLVAQTLADVTINEKNTYPGTDKKITAENGTAVTATTANDLSIGDTVTYTVPVTIPANVAEKEIVITDKMFKGLTLNPSSLANDKGLTLSFSDATVDGDYNIYTITIPAASVIAQKGQTITITYTATLNADAVIDGDNKNIVTLTYDNYTTTEHEVTTKTHKIEIEKTDGTTKLAGVKFTLTNADGKYYKSKSGTASVWTTTVTEFETTADANIVFDGVDAGTYTLTETFTPNGYNPLTAPITVTVAEDGTVKYSSTDPHNTASDAAATDGIITVVNQAGAVLPTTGGIGTTIFYILGAILVLGAGVVLVTRRRMSAR